jgi:ABC-type multidrug transport system fused ATPase/permease subunit
MAEMLEVESTTDPHQLGFRQVVAIFLRTYPYIRPLLPHLVKFVGAAALIFVWGAVIGLMLGGMVYNNILTDKPVGSLTAGLLGLDFATFVDVERLENAQRLELRWYALALGALWFGGIGPGVAALAYYRIWIFQRINQNLRLRLMEQLQALSLRFHSNSRIGDAMYRMYQDSAMVTQIIRTLVLEPLMAVGTYLFGLGVVALFNPWLASFLAVLSLPLFLLGSWMAARLRRGFRQAREANSALTSLVQETVDGIRAVKACGLESERQARFERHSRSAFAAAYDARTRLALYGVFAFLVAGSGMLFLELQGALFASVDAGVFARDVLLVFGFAIWNLGAFDAVRTRGLDAAANLESLMNTWGLAQDMVVGLGRVFRVLDLQPEVVDAPDARVLPAVHDSIRFDHVTFAYEERPVLRDVSFEAGVGTITALVGPTGAGKSTLMLLLLRLMDPDEGAINVDGIDVRKLRVDSLRGAVSVATQENILFSTSVRENIRYAAPDADDASVREAARVACADEFIEALSNGYDTILGERAQKLSTGQRQRLVIARALAKDTPILILDEPTAALDAETEHRVLENLREWGRDRTIFLITHRLSTIRRADKVVLLRDGRVCEAGVHDELVAARGPYRHFVDAELYGRVAE